MAPALVPPTLLPCGTEAAAQFAVPTGLPQDPQNATPSLKVAPQFPQNAM